MATDTTANTRAQINAAVKRLQSARASLQDTTPALKRVAIYMDQWVQRNFRDNGAKVGGWPPFKYGGRVTTKAKSTTAVQGPRGKIYIDPSAQLLRDTGRLRLSFIPFVNASEKQAGIGSALPYAKAHQEGDSARGLPKRRLLPEQKEVRGDTKDIIDDWMRQAMRKANGR